MVLISKRLRRRDHGLKSQRTDRAKPGIEPATPGLQGKKKNFCGYSMGSNQYWAGRVYELCVYFMTGTPRGSTESGFMEIPLHHRGMSGVAILFLHEWEILLKKNNTRLQGPFY